MKRRVFLKASLLTGSVTGIIPEMAQAANHKPNKKTTGEFYEVRVYSLKNAAQQRVVEDYFQNAAIPALNRLNSKPVGVFTELKPEGQTKLYAIIPYPSVNDFIAVQDKLVKEASYLKAGAAYLNAPATDPAYERIESSLLRSFTHFPEIIAPKNKQRIFELRRYESPNENAGKKKIEMFNEAGEIDIFKRTGLTPVFFGETMIGPLRPNLTYMITFADMDEHDRNWKAFGSDPEWKRIKSIPEYADAKIISRITSTFLSPVDFSQI